MRLLSCLLGSMLLSLALPSDASDDMLIYSDRFNNGWGDDWSLASMKAPPPVKPSRNFISTSFRD